MVQLWQRTGESWSPESLAGEVDNVGDSLCDGKAEQGVRAPPRKGAGCIEEGTWTWGEGFPVEEVARNTACHTGTVCVWLTGAVIYSAFL